MPLILARLTGGAGQGAELIERFITIAQDNWPFALTGVDFIGNVLEWIALDTNPETSVRGGFQGAGTIGYSITFQGICVDTIRHWAD